MPAIISRTFSAVISLETAPAYFPTLSVELGLGVHGAFTSTPHTTDSPSTAARLRLNLRVRLTSGHPAASLAVYRLLCVPEVPTSYLRFFSPAQSQAAEELPCPVTRRWVGCSDPLPCATSLGTLGSAQDS